MQVEQRAPSDLIPHPRNSRTHSPDQIRALGRAIKEWGFTQPVVVDEGGVILIGHGRVEAAKAIGMATVPVVVRAGLSDAKKRALLISDNRLAEVGSKWDEQTLTDELRYLSDLDYDVTLTAFDLPEFDPLPDDGESDGAESEPVTVSGDVWRLGRHRLACALGDTPAGLTAASGPLRASLMVTVAPEDPGTLAQMLLLADTVEVAYVWHAPVGSADAGEAMEAAGFDIRGQIVGVWPKALGGKRGRFARQFDLCWYGVRSGATASWRGGRAQSTLWPWETRDVRGGSLPVEAIRRPIVNHLPPEGVIIDPAAMLGASLIAAHQTGRVFVGAEADPGMVDSAVMRWQAMTGKEAVNEASGRSFGEMEAERA